MKNVLGSRAKQAVKISLVYSVNHVFSFNMATHHQMIKNIHPDYYNYSVFV